MPYYDDEAVKRIGQFVRNVRDMAALLDDRRLPLSWIEWAAIVGDADAALDALLGPTADARPLMDVTPLAE